MNRLALYHIETLLWISRLGTFSATAERLNATQPTISARVREMEAHLGYALFKREGRNMVLTVRARQLVSELEHLWNLLEGALIPADSPESLTGIVRLGCGEIAGVMCLPEVLSDINKTIPKLQLEVEIDISMNLQHRLEEGQIDLALLVGPVQERSLESACIGLAELCWFSTPERYDPFRGKSRHDLLSAMPIWSLPRLSHLHQYVTDILREEAIVSSTICTCNNLRTMIDLTVAGAGASMLPRSMVREHVEAGRLEMILPENTIKFEFYAAVRRSSQERAIREVFRRASLARIA
ncbi:LysR family transcriptional regulator [Devosia honganensis]|uniref:LysR family transcriptional regulator n=1 Tax=Devosia honganensis TaxID=1610527 RepID=A0ABV7WWQ1_9HYPH